MKKEEAQEAYLLQGDYWSSLCRASEVSTEQKPEGAHPHRTRGNTGS